MTALNFPAAPSDGDIFDNYVYDGTRAVWRLQPNIPDISSKFQVSATAPANPVNGEVWLNSTDGNTYIYYVDGDSSQWIEIGGNTAPPPDINDLNDVVITTPSDEQALVYDSGTGNWINADVAGGVEVSATAPVSPSAGDLWWNSDTGMLYVYYNDGSSSQWVSASDGQATISDTAPTGYNGQIWWNSDEGKMYVFYDDGTSSAWVAAGGPQVTVQATAPTGYEGQMWLDSTDGSMYVYYTDPGGGSSSWIGAVSRSGGILQVVSTTKNNPFATTSATFVDVTGLSATITPRSTSSKILVIAQVHIQNDNGSGFWAMNLVRDSTNLAQGTGGAVNDQTAYSQGVTSLFQSHVPIVNLDSPSTTSSVTYKIQVNRSAAGNTEVNGNSDSTAYSSITLMEVAG